MSVYSFAPSPDLSTKESLFATWENGFTDQQISEIIRIGESLNPKLASIGGKTPTNENIGEIRESLTSWIPIESNSAWLYDNMAGIARQINGQFFDFDLYGFFENFQYCIYNSNNNHYNWHLDKGETAAPRKLSMVLQLSDPSEYEGGDLQFMDSSEPITAKKQKGLVYVFPSWVLHRVTPVTRGIRRSLVVWVTGPKFK
jgi:PKHD-type hydroxylase